MAEWLAALVEPAVMLAVPAVVVMVGQVAAAEAVLVMVAGLVAGQVAMVAVASLHDHKTLAHFDQERWLSLALLQCSSSMCAVHWALRPTRM